MLNPDEERFLKEWPQRRLTYKKGLRKYLVGLPMAVFIVVALLVNIGAGWYGRAEAVLRSNSSMFITVLLAAVGIIIFMGEFTGRYKYDELEQKYAELQARAQRESN